MCIGIPMRVIDAGDGHAWCEGRGRRERLDMMLVGDMPAGTWVLAFNGCARRVMTGSEAARTDDALDALEAALAGETNFDAHFADLSRLDRQAPILPEETNP